MSDKLQFVAEACDKLKLAGQSYGRPESFSKVLIRRRENMSQASKKYGGRVLTILLVLFIVPGVVRPTVGRTPRFRGPKEFLPYTRNLPRIDKIELLKLELKDDRWNGEVAASKALQGAEAQKLASLWRHQTYTSSLSACHEPAYAIKFYYREKLIAYASVCWSCNSIFFITPNLHRTQSFLGGNERGEQLSEIFRLAFAATK